MAMGYEISVTPLQLATAYAVFANGGELVEPALVKEVLAPDGSVRYRHQRRVVRRVVPQAVAEKVRHMLLDVVDEGTALKASIDNFMLAGKTGTPRGTVRGRYVSGRYNPNFVGLFPGDAPQYVIVVKLTAPTSSIYAAQTAAPVTKAILTAAVAAQNVSLDRTKLASSVASAEKRDTARPPAPADGAVIAPKVQATAVQTANDGTVPFVVTLPVVRPQPVRAVLRPIPDVRGLSLRDAVRSLHNAGFRVQLARGSAGSAGTSPSAGSLASSGSLVRLFYDY
jgi:cell division protein FtsI (penicillin-binding protein 3)